MAKPDQSKKAIVCGATGTVGSALQAALARRGIPFVAGTRSEEKAGQLRDGCVEAAVLDFSDAASVRNALDGFDQLFVLLPMNPVWSNSGATLSRQPRPRASPT